MAIKNGTQLNRPAKPLSSLAGDIVPIK